jgi:hypothetical protein
MAIRIHLALGVVASAVIARGLSLPVARQDAPARFDAAPSYGGSLLGVRAVARLDRRRSVAFVQLEGVPLGGKLSGQAWFGDSGGVCLDPVLSRALSVRGSSVTGVVLKNEDLLEIVLHLPLIGQRTLVMHRRAL